MEGLEAREGDDESAHAVWQHFGDGGKKVHKQANAYPMYHVLIMPFRSPSDCIIIAGAIIIAI